MSDPHRPLRLSAVPHITRGGLDALADKVIPLLQEQGVYRTGYEGTTLRDNLGPAPAGAATTAEAAS
jgi:hypothetical protein